jgi:AcrR family transcriptional regulator
MTKSDIVKMAFSVWESDMYKSMSLSVLATSLGVSKTALYRHFRNKEAIVDAMFASFFDDYFAFVKPKFEEALKEKDETKGFFILVCGITEFYVRNRTAFIFSLSQLHDHQDDPSKNMHLQMKQQNVEIWKLPYLASRKNALLIIQLSSTISIFMTAMIFYSGNQHPSENDIQHLLDKTEQQISYGLGFSEKELSAINFDALNMIISQSFSVTLPSIDETNNLLKAVANAIAQSGAKDASMEMVAKHAGLSKSGLYSHFKSKADMLRQFFTIEFEKIYGDVAAFSQTSFPKTEKPEEQLYLLITSIIRYLQTRPEIMIALDWIRTQRIDLGLSMPEAILSRFSDSQFIKGDCPLSLQELPHFIIFCIMGFLKSHYCAGKEIDISIEDIQFLYRFLMLGIKGGKI